jgi:hypothetical protein
MAHLLNRAVVLEVFEGQTRRVSRAGVSGRRGRDRRTSSLVGHGFQVRGLATTLGGKAKITRPVRRLDP